MKDKIHPKVKTVTVKHTDGSTYVVLSTIKNDTIHISNNKDNYIAWSKTKDIKIIHNQKTKKYDLYGDIL